MTPKRSSWSKSPWRQDPPKKKPTRNPKPDFDRDPNPEAKEALEKRMQENRRLFIQKEKKRKEEQRKIFARARQVSSLPKQESQNLGSGEKQKQKLKKKPSVATLPWKDQIDKLSGLQKQSDFLLLQVVLVLLALGLVMVLSAGSYRAIIEYDDPYFFFKRQLVLAVFGLGVMLVMSLINADFVRSLSGIGMILVVGLLVIVMVFGEETLGAKRWLEIGGLRFSPSDLAKPITIVFVAHLLEKSLKTLHQLNGFIILTGVMLLVPVVIAVEDLGTATALATAVFVMIIVAGAPGKYLGGTVVAGLGLAAIGIFSQSYRVARLTSFLDPFSPENIQGNSWQLVQSLYALGSGGLAGVGLGNSGQKLLYLPEMHTDFIFSVIAEELGFIGAGLVVFLFFVFVWRGYWISMRIEDTYKSLCCFGLVSVIGAQAFINIGVAVGVLPITGITLPFISYGGTSLVASLATVGYILNLSRYMTPAPKKGLRRRRF